MRVLGFIFRVLLLVAIFAGVGIWASHVVLARAMAQGQPEYEVRLASYMAGLFIGGSVATLAGVLMLINDRRTGRRNKH